MNDFSFYSPFYNKNGHRDASVSVFTPVCHPFDLPNGIVFMTPKRYMSFHAPTTVFFLNQALTTLLERMQAVQTFIFTTEPFTNARTT